jgi:uncharacterized protein with PQ loop repeat
MRVHGINIIKCFHALLQELSNAASFPHTMKVFLKQTKLPLQTILSLLLLTKTSKAVATWMLVFCFVLKPALSIYGCMFSIEILRLTGLSSSISISASNHAVCIASPVAMPQNFVLHYVSMLLLFLAFLNSDQVKWIVISRPSQK